MPCTSVFTAQVCTGNKTAVKRKAMERPCTLGALTQPTVITGDSVGGVHAFQKMPLTARFLVTKRRNSWACRGNPNPEQETIKGTHTQETPAFRGLQGFQGPATQPTKLFCTFGGFLLSFLNAYAFLAIVSLCNNQNKAVTIDKAAKFSGAPR